MREGGPEMLMSSAEIRRACFLRLRVRLGAGVANTQRGPGNDSECAGNNTWDKTLTVEC